MRLENKVAIVTGAAQGMGFATAKIFTQHGARVAMIDVNTDKLLQAGQVVESLGAKPLMLDIDISDSTAVRHAVQDVHNAWERVDVLVNNAAIQSPGGNFVNATDEVWDRYLAVNVKSAGFLVREVIPLMQQQNGGSIINIGSISAMVVFPGQAVYAATKGAILQLTRAIAVDFGKDGIRANCICPGPTLSGPLANGVSEDGSLNPELADLANMHPLQRLAQPEDIAHASLFLASDESRHVTGVVLPVDGGFTAR
ncbi:MAG: SDR family oxidoreductase [Candidatus Poribacteria bacterium]|nr:SDR family oxidoreductase [Candidatus Poribacteria bacterium]